MMPPKSVKNAIRPAATFDGSPVSLFGFEEVVDIERKERFDLPRDGKSGRQKVKDKTWDKNGTDETDGRMGLRFQSEC
jgi:hypothetical protein